MFCVVCQDAVGAGEAQDAMECLQCKQALHEGCYNDYSEKLEEKRDDGIVPCPTCRHTVTMQAVKHRQWAALLNVIHNIRQRSDAGLLTDIPTITDVLSGILKSTPHSAVVVTYVCKCLYGISVGRDGLKLDFPPVASRCIATCLSMHHDDDELALWACAALYTLSRNVENDVMSAFPAIVTCMQTHKAVVIISYYAAMTFRTCLASDTTMAQEIVRIAVEPCLEALRYHRSPLISRAVSWLILTLALLPGHKTALGAAGCIQTLTDVLATHADKNDETTLYATSALLNLLYGSPENKIAACDVGLIRTASLILRHTVVTGVIVETCDILGCLVGYRSDVNAELGLCDSMSAVWETWCRNEHNAVVVKACMTTMLVFHRNGVTVDIGNVNEVALAACHVLLRFTAEEDAHVIKTAFKVITTVCVPGSLYVGVDKTISALSLLAVISRHASRDDHGQKHACRALTRLFQTGCLRLNGSDGCAEAAIDTVTDVFINSFYSTPRHAAMMLQALVEVSDVNVRSAFSRIGNCQKLQALKLVDAAFAETPQTKHALRALALICEDTADRESTSLTEVERMLVSCGILPTLVAVMRQKCDNGSPCVRLGMEADALFVLCSLCRDGSLWTQAADCGAVSGLVAFYFWTTDESVYPEIVRTVLRLVSDNCRNALALFDNSLGVTMLTVSATKGHTFCVDGVDFWVRIGVLLQHGFVSDIPTTALRRVADACFSFCSHQQWCVMLQADMSDWCLVFSEVLRRCYNVDANICFDLCYVMDTVLLSNAVPSLRAVVETVLMTLTVVLQARCADLFLACWIARCMIRFGDVHDTLFCQSGATLAISDAYDSHPNDDTLFTCLQHACTINAGCQFFSSMLRTCGRVL